MFIIPSIGWGTAGDMTVSLSGAGVEGVVVKVAIGDGSWREVGEAGGGGVVVGGPEVGRPALEVVVVHTYESQMKTLQSSRKTVHCSKGFKNFQ